MMKRQVLILLVLCAVAVSGCDFFRALAGRPLSADIQAKREKMEFALRQKEQRRLDSLERVRKVESDSLAAVSRLSELSAVILEAGSLGGLALDAAPGYSIVVGSFKNAANAEKLVNRIGEGYEVAVKAFKNGMYAVTLCESPSIVQLAADYENILNEKFCPSDVWILKN